MWPRSSADERRRATNCGEYPIGYPLAPCDGFVKPIRSHESALCVVTSAAGEAAQRRDVAEPARHFCVSEEATTDRLTNHDMLGPIASGLPRFAVIAPSVDEIPEGPLDASVV
jgi:hypothetical protein